MRTTEDQLDAPRGLVLELGAWLCAGLAVFCFLRLTTNTNWILLSNDGYQYLSEARNILTGKGFCTSLLNFDENLHTGIIPAPQTAFPPGYPIATAGVQFLGVDERAAGVAVSLASFACTMALLLYIGRLLDIRTAALRYALFLMLCSGAAWIFAICVSTESLFTALTLLGLGLLLTAESLENRPRARTCYLIIGCCIVGLSYWVRYAGCFLIATVSCYFTTRWLVDRRRDRFRDAALATGILAALVLPLWIRNALLIMSWGGALKAVNKPLPTILSQFFFDWVELITGYFSQTVRAGTVVRVNRVLLALCIASVLAAVVPYVVRARKSILRDGRGRLLALLGAYVMVYIVGITYVGKNTSISYESPRMFLPIYPVVLLGLAALFPTRGHRVVRPSIRPVFISLLVVTAVSYTVGQAHGLLRRNQVGQHELIRRWLAEPIHGTKDIDARPTSLADWIETNIPANGVVIAGDGQACGYVLQRGCLAPPSTEYSSHIWNEADTRAVASRYGARHVLLFPEGQLTKLLALESPFFAQLLSGHGPDWLPRAVWTDHCIVYRVLDESRMPLTGSDGTRISVGLVPLVTAH